jgi:hypothetical protein
MLLMPKLSATLLLCASVYGATDADVVSFLKKGIGNNSNISNLQVDINGKRNVSEMRGWQAYFVSIEADVKQGAENRHLNQNGTYFVNGDTIAPELVNLKTGERYNDTIAPAFSASYYTKANLISGDANAKNKVVIFSDPLCPFCRKFVPEAVTYMTKYPKTFAVYYYHFPLAQLHPASVALTKVAIAAEQSGVDNVTLKMYQVDIDANEKSEQKIIDACNKVFGTKLIVADLRRSSVVKQFDADQKVVHAMMVNGTPTVFFNGEKDTKKTKYKEVKVQ